MEQRSRNKLGKPLREVGASKFVMTEAVAWLETDFRRFLWNENGELTVTVAPMLTIKDDFIDDENMVQPFWLTPPARWPTPPALDDLNLDEEYEVDDD